MLRLQILLYELLRENQQRERSKITPHIHIRVKHPFLSQHHQSSLALLIVCLINCPCNCFCVHCVLLLFFFLYLYSFGVFLSSFSSIAHAAITNISLLSFSPNFLTPKLLPPQYLALQSILCCLHFLIYTVGLHYS